MDSPLQSRRQVLAGITAATIAGTASAATASSPVVLEQADRMARSIRA